MNDIDLTKKWTAHIDPLSITFGDVTTPFGEWICVFLNPDMTDVEKLRIKYVSRLLASAPEIYLALQALISEAKKAHAFLDDEIENRRPGHDATDEYLAEPMHLSDSLANALLKAMQASKTE